MSLFRHGVASGDPDVDRVVIWTRVTASGGAPVELGWSLAEDESFKSVHRSGSVVASSDTDFTAQVDVGGLQPGRHYWYRFQAPTGEQSPVGRTKTLPALGLEHVRFAIVSCAKFNNGFFNGYARIAGRDDFDFVLHLGDYIIEASETPPAGQMPGAGIGRPFEPRDECVTLSDYRTRYAQYRADPDTQAMHQAHPLMAAIDDRELADGGWRDGSDNHLPERDGPWAERRVAALKARHEWLPQRLPDPADPERVFCSVALTPERVRVEWWFVDGILARTPAERLAASAEVLTGSPLIVTQSFPST